jgi:hypothetical protein
MSKTHLTDQDDDLEALQQFIKNKQVKPVVTSASEGIDLFRTSEPEKKKLIPFRQRLINLLNRFRQMAL